jgi:hypothetical protein
VTLSQSVTNVTKRDRTWQMWQSVTYFCDMCDIFCDMCDTWVTYVTHRDMCDTSWHVWHIVTCVTLLWHSVTYVYTVLQYSVIVCHTLIIKHKTHLPHTVWYLLQWHVAHVSKCDTLLKIWQWIWVINEQQIPWICKNDE